MIHSLQKDDKHKIYEIVSNALAFTKTHIALTRLDKSDIPTQILSTIWQDVANRLKKYGNEELRNFA